MVNSPTNADQFPMLAAIKLHSANRKCKHETSVKTLPTKTTNDARELSSNHQFPPTPFISHYDSHSHHDVLNYELTNERNAISNNLMVRSVNYDFDLDFHSTEVLCTCSRAIFSNGQCCSVNVNI